MTINEAIKVLEMELRLANKQPETGTSGALKLGIDALERLRDMRISPCTTADEILPGETT